MNEAKPADARTGPKATAARSWSALVVLGLLVGGCVSFVAMGWQKLISVDSIVDHYAMLRGLVGENLTLSLLAFAAIYIVAVALSLPIATPLTLAGGLLFGWRIAAPVIVLSATLGASAMFLIAKSALGGALRAQAGPWLAKLSDGFKANALSYMLFLRLVPAFPFVIVNLAPALLGVPLSTFFLATFLGIIPGTVAYTIAGEGLGTVVMTQAQAYSDCMRAQSTGVNSGALQPCHHTIDISALVTREIILACAIMGLLALLPVGIKFWSKKRAAKA